MTSTCNTLRTTQEYLILSVTTSTGKVVNLRGQGVRFKPVGLTSAVVSPAIAGMRVGLRSIRYRIRARLGHFVKTGHFRHKIDCALTWTPGKQTNRLRSKCGPLFTKVPLDDILDSRKFGNTMGVQFVA